jgi:hypothetical membrane protein
MRRKLGDADTDGVQGNTRHVEQEGVYIRYLAVVAVVVTVGCMLLATVVSPAFAWRENALSNLGVTWTDAGTTTTAILFNGGLITGGLVGVTVAVSLYRRVTRRADRVVVALAGTALVLMGLVGVFPQGTTPHFPVAIGFFLLVSGVMWVDGGLRMRAGEHRWGGLTVAGGTANILAWVVWFRVVEEPFEGLAIPEMAGAGVFAAWLLAAAIRLSPPEDNPG